MMEFIRARWKLVGEGTRKAHIPGGWKGWLWTETEKKQARHDPHD